LSTRLRFTTARQVFDAFPTIAADVELRPADEPPIDFARKLLVRAYRFEAIAYAAYLLPRREAVWWGCQCVRAISGDKVDDAVLAAEAWVRDPEEDQRRAALSVLQSRDRRIATTWLAMAAGHSGGSIVTEGLRPVAASPQTTATSVKVAIVLAIARTPLPDQSAWINACVDSAIRFAEGGDAKVRMPTKAGAA
jgi:hypothetical protein